MKVTNFLNLLCKIQQADINAVSEWAEYIKAHGLKDQEITQAQAYIDGILSEKGHNQRSNALNLSALMHQAGLVEEKVNYFKVFKLYQEAIGLNNPMAMINRAFMHANGIGGKRDYPAAIKLYGQAIRLKNPIAMTNRAFMYENGIGGEKNYPAAIKLYEEAIRLGNTTAMNRRADMHRDAQVAPVNNDKAIKLYERAIQSGDVYAMLSRAFMHVNGIGGAKNYSAAIKLYDEAITLGNATAMNERALMYLEEKDYAKAIKLFEEAIKLENPRAMFNRAVLHEKGIGSDTNYSQAIKLYKKAARLNDPDAMKIDLASLKKLDDQKSLEEFKKNPAIADLFNKIRIMKHYGWHLKDDQEINTKKGDVILNLASTLKEELNKFLLKSAKSTPTKKSIQEFKERFTKQLHSIENKKILDEHRTLWKPILANILIALTGIGFLAIFTKVIQNAIDSHSKNKPISLNESLFFAKTSSRNLAEKIDESLKGLSLT